MEIDISGIKENVGASIVFDFEEALPFLKNVREDCSFSETATFKGEITNNKGIYSLRGRFGTGYTTHCSRCMRPLEREIDIEIKEEIVNTDGAEEYTEEGIYTFFGDCLSLDGILRDNTLLWLPMKEVCDAECKGLCSKCGKDLNEGMCRCPKEDIDERMATLKDLF